MRRFVCNIMGVTFLALAGAWGCGKGKGGGGGGSSKPAPVETAFANAAADAGVPARYMKAIAYLESRMVAEQASANYVALDSAADPIARGTFMTETAFGLTMEELGLDAASEQSQVLEVQINAYAQWLKAKLASANLPSPPRTPEETYYWIEKLAGLHRHWMTQRRNVQIIFARELIDLLNSGFVWQDPRSGERVELTAESPPINIEKFPPNGQAWMALAERPATLRATATYLPLITVPSNEFVNTPRRIEIIHCPLSLSACLELQSRDGVENDVHLAAHYVIPANRNISMKILQVADHKDSILLTDARGQSTQVVDAIVVMLVGNPGRLLHGERRPADPTWFNDGQLRDLGRLVNDLCTFLAQDTPDLVQRESCMAMNGDLGLKFRHQGASEEFRWGDIADFEPSIFEAYLVNPDGLATEAAFELAQGRREFASGQVVPLNVVFNSSARTVELERLSRCRDGNVVWEPQETMQVRGEYRAAFRKTLYDSGPNQNGEQFFRTRVYGEDGALIGWAIDRIILHGFESEPAFASNKHCRKS